MKEQQRHPALCSHSSQSQLRINYTVFPQVIAGIHKRHFLTTCLRSGDMATNVELDWNFFSCCLCLDPLKDPVTTACGHSYCSQCIEDHWDVEEEKGIFSCPQCRTAFAPRPVLMKSTMLADLMETLEKNGLLQVHTDQCFAAAEDVACDVCTGRKLKAFKSCLVCRASYCNPHLQPHRHSSAFERHKLVDPTRDFQDICTQHKEKMELLSKAEPLSRCRFCSVNEHREQRHLACFHRDYQPMIARELIEGRIKDREMDLKELQWEMRSIEDSAGQVVDEQEKILSQLEKLLSQKFYEVAD